MLFLNCVKPGGVQKSKLSTTRPHLNIRSPSCTAMIRLTNLRGLQIKSISDGNVIRSPLNNMTKPEGLHTALNTRVQSPTQPIRTKWHRVPDPSTFSKQNRGTNRHGMLKPGVLMSDVDPKKYPNDVDPFTEEDYSQMGQPTHVLNRGDFTQRTFQEDNHRLLRSAPSLSQDD